VTDTTEDRIIWRSEITRKLGGICSQTLRRWMASGKLPKPDVMITRRSMGWRHSTLKAAGIDWV